MIDGYVYKQTAIDAVHKSILDFFDICDDDEESPMTYKDEWLLELNKAITTRIKAVPSADVVEVVRCKDCDSAECSGVMIYCLTHGCYMRDNDFCNYGEWKDDDTDG